MAIVLMQSSKGNGLAGPIGGSNVTMAFGVRRTSDLLSKSTTVLAAMLMVGCIAVNLMIGGEGTVNESIIQKNAGEQQQQMPPPSLPPDQTQPPTGQPDQNQQPPTGQPDQNQQNDQNKPPVDVAPADK